MLKTEHCVTGSTGLGRTHLAIALGNINSADFDQLPEHLRLAHIQYLIANAANGGH